MEPGHCEPVEGECQINWTGSLKKARLARVQRLDPGNLRKVRQGTAEPDGGHEACGGQKLDRLVRWLPVEVVLPPCQGEVTKSGRPLGADGECP